MSSFGAGSLSELREQLRGVCRPLQRKGVLRATAVPVLVSQLGVRRLADLGSIVGDDLRALTVGGTPRQVEAAREAFEDAAVARDSSDDAARPAGAGAASASDGGDSDSSGGGGRRPARLTTPGSGSRSPRRRRSSSSSAAAAAAAAAAATRHDGGHAHHRASKRRPASPTRVVSSTYVEAPVGGHTPSVDPSRARAAARRRDSGAARGLAAAVGAGPLAMCVLFAVLAVAVPAPLFSTPTASYPLAIVLVQAFGSAPAAGARDDPGVLAAASDWVRAAVSTSAADSVHWQWEDMAALPRAALSGGALLVVVGVLFAALAASQGRSATPVIAALGVALLDAGALAAGASLRAGSVLLNAAAVAWLWAWRPRRRARAQRRGAGR